MRFTLPALAAPLLLASAAPALAGEVRPRASLIASDSDLRQADFGVLPHLGLDADTAELGGGLSLGVRLSLFVPNTEGSISLQDVSSRLLLRWRPDAWAQGEGLTVTLLPLNARRLHLGYEPLAAWGRAPFPVGRSGQGVQVELGRARWTAFVAAKSALLQNDLTHESKRRLALMAGGGAEVLPFLRLDVGGGHFDAGDIPALALGGIDEQASTWGVSGRVALHSGSAVGGPVDISLYRSTPEFFDETVPELYDGGLSTWLALEASHLSQRLADPDAFGALRSQGADAVALQARAKLGFGRVQLLGLYRSASFIQSDGPGLPPFSAFPAAAGTEGERMLTLSGDYHFAGSGLTPGVLLRATLPASIELPGLLGPGRQAVLSGLNQLTVLPEGEDVGTVLQAKLTCRWDAAQGHLAVLGEAFLTHDPNRVAFQDDLSGVAQPVPQAPRAGGFSLYVQARY